MYSISYLCTVVFAHIIKINRAITKKTILPCFHTINEMKSSACQTLLTLLNLCLLNVCQNSQRHKQPIGKSTHHNVFVF